MRFGPRAVSLAFISLALAGLAGCATTSTPEVRESRQMDPSFARQNVSYATRKPAGTIVVDPFPLSGPRRRQGRSLWRWRRRRGIRLVGSRHHSLQAGVAGLVS